MSGETSDVSQFCEIGFYECIMFWEEPDHAQFPADNPILGRYLGPAIGIGLAMTAKILKSNGKVIFQSTYCALTDFEVASMVHIALQEAFDEAIEDKYGLDCNPDNFLDIGLEDTPHYNKFNDVNMDLCHQDKEWLS